MGRGRAGWTAIGIAVVAVLLAGAGLLAWRLSSDGGSTTSEPITVPDGLQFGMQPVTGVRSGASTAVLGTVINTGSTALSVAFTVESLPAGSTAMTVLPAASSSAPGWSCASLRCTWVGAGSTAATLAPRTSAQALLAFDAPPTAAGSDLTVTVDGLAPSTVPLSLPDGAAPLAANAITVALSAPSTVLLGSPVTATARVTNFSASPIAAGTTSVTVSPPAVAGLTVTPAGDGWTCVGLTCSYGDALSEYAVTTPLQLVESAPAGVTDASGTLGVTATATAGTATMTASASKDTEVRPPRSTSVSTRIQLDTNSVVEGSTINATLAITPIGVGAMSDTIAVGLRLPDGLDADWSAATVDGPWTCSTDGCSSTAPLVVGTATTVTVPITVAPGTRPGTVHLSSTTTIASGSDLADQRPATASVVVVAAAAVQMRARLLAATGADPHGAAVSFAPGAPRALELEVTDRGPGSLRSGSAVVVVATPSKAVRLESVGGEGWTCSPSIGSVSPSAPLQCTTTLTEDLLPDVPMTVPVTLAPDGPSDSDWLVGAGTTAAAAKQNRMRTRVSVVAQAPRFVPAIVAGSPLHQGANGQVLIDVSNHSDELASGGVAVITIPADATVVRAVSPAWNCVLGDVSGGNGVVTCSTSAVVGPRRSAPPIILDVAIVGAPSQIEVSAWTNAVGQFDAGRADVVTATLPVASAVVVDAGPDLTVVTPQTGPNGVPAPAIVQLRGSTELANAKSVAWTQLCTVDGEDGCGASVSPAVTWLGVPAGRAPTTLTARFTAPTIDGAQDLFFRLTGIVGTTAISDDVLVHLIPPSSTVSTAGANGSSSGSSTTGGSSGNSAGDSAPGVLTPPSPVPVPVDVVPPTATIAGSGSALQVPTRATAQLIGGGTGSGPLTFAWTQTAGADATILGSSAAQPTLQFTTPTLAPDQQDETLSFALTVTDSTGATATSSIDVQVIWGDDGLQVTLAGGAANVVATIDSPIVITSSVQSRGAPYTYVWSVADIALPSGAPTDASSLAFAAPDAAADGTATLTVTDSFGRETTLSIPVIVSALPAGQLPAAFCDAIAALQSGSLATIAGQGVQFSIPAGTISTPTCAAGTIVSFSNASATLPGGISLSGASGQLTIAGVSVTTASAAVPTNWNLTGTSVGAGGVLAPFVSSAAIGVPTGSLTASSTPFLAPSGWTGSTTITFTAGTAGPTPNAVVSASANGTTPGSTLQITGSSTAGATTADLSATGLLGIGTVDIPVAGSFTTANATATPVWAVKGSLSVSTPLAAGVSAQSADLAWTPQQSTGSVTLSIGQGAGALVLVSPSTVVTPTATTFSFPGTTNQWSSAPGSPPMVLSGTGSVTGGQLVIGATSQPSGAWTIGAQLSLAGLQATVAIDCPIDASTPCAPTITATANATSSTFGGSVAVTGPFDPSTATATLTGSAGSITVTPLVVTGSTLTIGISPQSSPTATATGTASVLGSSAAASVSFGAQSTVADVAFGSLTLVSGWQIPSVSVLATTAPFTYSTTIAAAGGASVSVPIPAGALTGVGVTQIPSSITGSSIPSNVTTGLAAFAVGSGAVTSYTITAPIPTPWYLAGASSADLSLSITSVTFDVAISGSTATVTMDGTATMTAAAVVGAPTTVPMTFQNANLASGSMNITFTTTSGTTWTNAFGASGFGATDVTATYLTTSGGPQVTLGGTLVVPSSLLSAIGAPATAAPTFTTDVTDGSLCVSADLATGGGIGVNVSGYELLYSSTAYLVLAPSACTIAGTSVGAGITVVVTGGSLGNLSMTVDTTTFGLTTSISQPSLDIGGVTLANATVAVTSGAPTSPGGPPTPGTPASPAVTVSGSLTIGSASVRVSAVAQGPTGSVGTLTFTATDVPVTLDWLTIPSASVTVTVPTVVVTVATASAVTVTGSMTVMGAAISPTLTGAIIGGELTQLTGTAASQTYSLANGDTFTGALTITYDSSPASGSSLTVSGSGELAIVESSSATRVYAVSDLSVGAVDSATSLSITAMTGFATTAAVGTSSMFVTVSGTYALSGGSYQFTNQTTATPTLAGYMPGTEVVFARTGSTVTAEQTSTFDMGLFDDDVQTVMSGSLSVGPTSTTNETTPSAKASTATATLTGSTNGQSIRGLAGTASFSVAPPASALTQTAAATVIYVNTVTFVTALGDCSLWDTTPTLTGVAYRSQKGTSSGNTFYTLAGSTTVIFPGGISPATFSGAGNQPVVLTNEVLPDAPTTNGFSLTIPMFDAGAVSATGTMAFDFADCSFSLGGTAVVNVTGSAALESALGQQQGIQVQVGSLFGDGNSLPPSTVIARALYQAESLSATYAQNLTTATTNRQNAATTLANRNEAATTANENLQNAQDALDQANADLRSAAARALGSVGSAMAAYVRSGGNLAASQQVLDQAKQAVNDAKAAVTTANATVTTTTEAATTAAADVTTATAEADRANTVAQAAETTAANSPTNPKLVQLSIDWTHCLTCSSVDSITVSGEVNVGLVVVEGDIEFQFGDGSLTSAQITIGGGFEEQRQVGSNEFGAFVQGEAVLQVTGGRTFPPTPNPSWFDISATLSATADLDVYLNTWCCSFNEQLLSLELQGSIQFLPTPISYSFSGEAEILTFTFSFNVGPDPF